MEYIYIEREGGGMSDLRERIYIYILYILTGDRRLDINHRLFGAEEGRAVVDDAERRGLVDPPLEDEVLLEDIRSWPQRPRVEHLGHGELARRWEWHICGQSNA